MMDQVGLRVEGVVKQLVLVSRNVFKMKNMNFARLYKIKLIKSNFKLSVF